jgi:hypothetical protein
VRSWPSGLEQRLGLREQINKKPGVASGAVGAAVILMILFVFWQIRGGRAPTKLSIQSFYTIDDGRTWFADDYDKVAPFDHDGTPAVHCFVFKCSPSAPFAGYLQKFTPAMYDQMTGLTKPDAQHSMLSPSGQILVKKPGDKNWVLSYTPEGLNVMEVHCPGGSTERPQPVNP